MTPAGFRIHYFRDLEELRPVAMDASVPRAVQESCPCCGGALATLATLVAGDVLDRIRLGYCALCGYRGYCDRPAAVWFDRFYSEEWDNARQRNAAAEAGRLQPHLSEVQRSSVRLAGRVARDRSRPVCEIGCGFGSALKEFETLGFRNVIGVEPSRFRGAVTRAAYGHRVLTGAFEDARTVAALRRDAPIGVFYSYHALEHAYDPPALIAAAARVQGTGDWLVVAVPDAEREPPVMTLFWLPHLHAFTAASLRHLLSRNGYEIIERETAYPGHLIVAARRVAHPAATSMASAPPIQDAARAIRDHFRLGELRSGRRYRFSWKKKTYRTALSRAPALRLVDRVLRQSERLRNIAAAHLLGRFYASRSLVMSALADRSMAEDASPFEVRYDGPIELLIR